MSAISVLTAVDGGLFVVIGITRLLVEDAGRAGRYQVISAHLSTATDRTLRRLRT